jgi:hypothetical protein
MNMDDLFKALGRFVVEALLTREQLIEENVKLRAELDALKRQASDAGAAAE